MVTVHREAYKYSSFSQHPSTGAVYAIWSELVIDGKVNFTYNKAADDGGKLWRGGGSSGL